MLQPRNALLLTMIMSALASPSAAAPPQRLFFSGHSLLDQPLPTNVELIASSLDTPVQWNRQYGYGGSIRSRIRGPKAGPDEQGFDGYRQGRNRDGEGMDVLAEWRQPRTVDGSYDAMIVTEQHAVLGAMIWHDTVRALRQYHDRFIEGNPRARTFFYESWLSVDDMDDPKRWIAYERSASPLWQCVGTRINASMAGEGRVDRIEALPAAWAFAGLVEQATQGPGVPGVSGRTARETMSRLFSDDVHLTPLGAYFVSLVTYAVVFDRSPLGASAPAAVGDVAARSLQTIAWEQVQLERKQRRPLTLEACRAFLQNSFIADYWAYVRDVALIKQRGRVLGNLQWVKLRLQWHWLLREGNAKHPLKYDPATDSRYWWPTR